MEENNSMSFVEFIVFAVTFILFLLLSAKQAREEKIRRESPQKFKAEETEGKHKLVNTLKTMGITLGEKELYDDDLEEETDTESFEEFDEVTESYQQIVKPPPVPPVLSPNLSFQDMPDEPIKQKTRLVLEMQYNHANAYDIQVSKPNKRTRIIKGAANLREAVLMREILDPPKGL